MNGIRKRKAETEKLKLGNGRHNCYKSFLLRMRELCAISLPYLERMFFSVLKVGMISIVTSLDIITAGPHTISVHNPHCCVVLVWFQ